MPKVVVLFPTTPPLFRCSSEVSLPLISPVSTDAVRLLAGVGGLGHGDALQWLPSFDSPHLHPDDGGIGNHKGRPAQQKREKKKSLNINYDSFIQIL